MEDFYREQRRRFGILMDVDRPVGNRWNYDEDNRESPPKKQARLDVPPPYQPREDDIDEKVRRDLDGMELDSVGVDGPRLFAVTPDEAKRPWRGSSNTDFHRSDATRTRSWATTGRCRTLCCRSR
jgi:deoxyribodipyrimidine photolyase-related protein